jgi:hypothetical protein
MHRRDIRALAVGAICFVVLAAILIGFSLLSMRVAYRRAYVEIAASCRRVSVVTVERSKFLCAPVSRVESATDNPMREL